MENPILDDPKVESFKEELLRFVPEDGSSIGNKSLREKPTGRSRMRHLHACGREVPNELALWLKRELMKQLYDHDRHVRFLSSGTYHRVRLFLRTLVSMRRIRYAVAPGWRRHAPSACLRSRYQPKRLGAIDRKELPLMKEHHHRNGHAHFTTLSTYHRMRLLDSERFKRWVETLDELRGEVGFRLLGYGSDAGAFPFVDLPGRAGRIFKDQRQSEAEDCPIHQEPENMLELPVVPRNQGMMQGIALPDSLHDESTYRVWQRRCYDFDVWSAKKRLEKLESMHGNPVKRKKDGKESWRLAMVQLEVLSLER